MNTIVLCEPQCCGFEHSNVNAALLAVVRRAFPTSEIVFFGEEGHLGVVRGLLAAHSVEGIHLRAIGVPERSSQRIARFPGELALFNRVFEFARCRAITKLLFTSITSEGLYSLKACMVRHRDMRCFVIPHSVLAGVLQRPPFRPTRVPFWFRVPFQLWNPDRLTYVVLGAPIRQRIVSKFPRLERNLAELDHPYFFEPPQDERVELGEAIGFGALGVASRRKGTPQFFRLAERITSSASRRQARFVVAGSIVDASLGESPSCVTMPSPSAPLTPQDFARVARDIDYAVFMHDPSEYRVVVSGALFDAFSYVKPIIAIRNPIFEHYFSLMGDIGHLCGSPSDIESTIRKILNEPSRERYRTQQRNIVEGRRRIDIPRLAEDFQRIWGQ